MPKTKQESSSLLARGLSVLSFVSSAGRPVTIQEIGDAGKLPKPTAHRICRTLTEMGLLAKEVHPKKFNMGPGFTSMALAALFSTVALGPRRATLRQVVDDVQETCTLSVLEYDELVFLDRVESDSPLRVQLFAGSRLPLHCTSAGKLFLAMMPSRRRDWLIRVRPLKRYTENTITDPGRLARELEEIHAEKLGRSNQEYIEGLVGLAVPILNSKGRMVAAVSVNGPASRVSIDKKERYVNALRRAAASLAISFECTPP